MRFSYFDNFNRKALALACLFHDIAYPIEQAQNILDITIGVLTDPFGYIKSEKAIIEIEEDNIRDFLDILIEHAKEKGFDRSRINNLLNDGCSNKERMLAWLLAIVHSTTAGCCSEYCYIKNGYTTQS